MAFNNPQHLFEKNITMRFVKLLAPTALAIGSTLILSSCVNISPYKEPIDGPTAKLRVIGSSPTIYANSSCIKRKAANTSLPKNALGGLRRSDRNMPIEEGDNTRTVEVLIPADAPVTIYLEGYNGEGNMRSTASCGAHRSFMAVNGKNYEASIQMDNANKRCRMDVLEIWNDENGQYQEKPVSITRATVCPK